jgi:hypothetical protein
MSRSFSRSLEIFRSQGLGTFFECQRSALWFVSHLDKPVAEAVGTRSAWGGEFSTGRQFPQPGPTVAWRGPLRLSSCLTVRETDCYAWHGPTDRHTGLDTALSKGKTRWPRVLCLQKRIFQEDYSCSFCAASRRLLGPAVSYEVKALEPMGGRNWNG